MNPPTDLPPEAIGLDHAYESLKLDYWKVAGAMCRAAEELGYDVGQEAGQSMVNLLAVELSKEYPNLGWANVMTDDWPLEHERRVWFT